jgi:hypothetical protein
MREYDRARVHENRIGPRVVQMVVRINHKSCWQLTRCQTSAAGRLTSMSIRIVTNVGATPTTPCAEAMVAQAVIARANLIVTL